MRRSGSWAHSASQAACIGFRYDDGINSVRRDRRDPTHEDRCRCTYSTFLDALRLMSAENDLPLESMEEALLEHWALTDPNNWLTDVQRVSAAALYLFSYESFLDDAEHGPRWHFIDNTIRLPHHVSDRVEAQYRNPVYNPLVSYSGIKPSASTNSPGGLLRSTAITAIADKDAALALKCFTDILGNFDDATRPPVELFLLPNKVEAGASPITAPAEQRETKETAAGESVIQALQTLLDLEWLESVEDTKLGAIDIYAALSPAVLKVGLVSIPTKKVLVPLHDVYRTCQPDKVSFRSVLQHRACEGCWSQSESMIYDALVDAVTYATTEPQKSHTSVFKILASFFRTSRMYASGRLVTFPAAVLATTSTTVINSLALQVSPHMPSPIRFELCTSHVYPFDVHSMYPRAGEVLIPPNSTFLVDSAEKTGDDEGDSNNIVATQVEPSRVLNLQLKALLRDAPSPLSTQCIWGVLHGKRVLVFSPPTSALPADCWMVLMESVESPIEDFFLLYGFDTALISQWIPAFVEHKPGVTLNTTSSLGSLQVNTSTLRGKLVDTSAVVEIQRALSIHPVANECNCLTDADILFLCSALKLNPSVNVIRVDGHSKVTATSLDPIFQVLGVNTVVKEFTLRNCRIAKPLCDAIAAFAAAGRRHGTVRVDMKWWSALQSQSVDAPAKSLSEALTHVGSAIHGLHVHYGEIEHLFDDAPHWSSSITDLVLENVQHHGDIAELCQGLRNLTHLKSITLSNVICASDDDLVEAVAALVCSAPLAAISIEHMQVRVAALTTLSAAIAEAKTPLHLLELHSFAIADSGLRASLGGASGESSGPMSPMFPVWEPFVQNLRKCFALQRLSFLNSEIPTEVLRQCCLGVVDNMQTRGLMSKDQADEMRLELNGEGLAGSASFSTNMSGAKY